MRKRIKTEGLEDEHFTTIAAGQTIEVTVDMASVHDLSAGGIYRVSTYGAIPYAEVGSTTLVPGHQALAYNSNELEIKVDGAIAAKVPRALASLSKRTTIQSGCSSTQLLDLTQALGSCS